MGSPCRLAERWRCITKHDQWNERYEDSLARIENYIN
jgi:hypothetical protein